MNGSFTIYYELDKQTLKKRWLEEEEYEVDLEVEVDADEVAVALKEDLIDIFLESGNKYFSLYESDVKKMVNRLGIVIPPLSKEIETAQEKNEYVSRYIDVYKQYQQRYRTKRGNRIDGETFFLFTYYVTNDCQKNLFICDDKLITKKQRAYYARSLFANDTLSDLFDYGKPQVHPSQQLIEVKINKAYKFDSLLTEENVEGRINDYLLWLKGSKEKQGVHK